MLPAPGGHDAFFHQAVGLPARGNPSPLRPAGHREEGSPLHERHRGSRAGAVNAVTPGFIATDMLASIPDRVLDNIRSQIPVGRLGKPEEIARAVCSLASDDSSCITGQIWAVKGGLDM